MPNTQSIPGHSLVEIYDSLEIAIMGNHSTSHLSSQIGTLSNSESTAQSYKPCLLQFDLVAEGIMGCLLGCYRTCSVQNFVHKLYI
jgi:hypothetical protein